MSLLVLSCDAGESDGEFSIGVVVRQNPPKGNKPLQVVAYLSKKIDPEKSFGAEYRAVIEGVKLAAHYKPTTLHVFTDNRSVAAEINKSESKVKSNRKAVWTETWDAIKATGARDVLVSWLPRELNEEAHQRAADAFLNPLGDARGRPLHT
jgi:ribonuclease HI